MPCRALAPQTCKHIGPLTNDISWWTKKPGRGAEIDRAQEKDFVLSSCCWRFVHRLKLIGKTHMGRNKATHHGEKFQGACWRQSNILGDTGRCHRRRTLPVFRPRDHKNIPLGQADSAPSETSNSSDSHRCDDWP